MKKYYEVPSWLELVLKCLLFISLSFLSLFLCKLCEQWVMFVSFGCSLIVSFIIVKFFVKNLYKKINICSIIIALLISLLIGAIYSYYHLAPRFVNNFYHFSFYWVAIICFLSLPAIITIFYVLINNVLPIIKNFFIDLSRFEKIFLIVLAICSFALTGIIYNLTTAFYYSPSINYDIIYTSDSSSLFRGDAFFNINMPENDIRQPLFGLFAFPFALIAKILSILLFFIPNSYAIFLTTIQIFLLGIIAIMISKLAGLNGKREFNFILLYFSCFSTIVFSFVLEQYIIGLFYLVLLVYIYCNSKREVNYMYIAGPGTLLTTGIMFPFISKFKNLKYWLKNVFKCFLCFLIIMIIFGQISLVFSISDSLESLLGSFSGEKIPFEHKLMQYFNFIKGIALAIPASDTFTNLFNVPHHAYFLDNVYHYSKIGILIFVICLVSAFMNRKNKMAIISCAWMIFSFILLCVIGWGTAENGLNLYSLYFSWAFILLIYLFVDKIIKHDKIKTIIIIIICIGLLFINVPEFINIIKFGIAHYPA